MLQQSWGCWWTGKGLEVVPVLICKLPEMLHSPTVLSLSPVTPVCCSLAGPVLGAGSRAAVESLAVPWELDWELSPARVTARGGCAGAAAEPWPCWTGVAVLGGHEGLSQACPSWPFLPSSPAISSPPCPGCCWSLIQV